MLYNSFIITSYYITQQIKMTIIFLKNPIFFLELFFTRVRIDTYWLKPKLEDNKLMLKYLSTIVKLRIVQKSIN